MRVRALFVRLFASLAFRPAATLLLAAPAALAGDIAAPPGFNVETLAGPSIAAVLADGTVLVGSGSFGADSLSVRHADGSITLFADGFGSLAGVAQSPVTGDIIVGDSGFLPALHVLRDLNADGDALDAGENEPHPAVLPRLANGAPPLPYALSFRPGTDELYLSGSTHFSVSPTLGVVLRIVGADAGVFAEGLGYAGGLTWGADTLYAADLHTVTFAGRVLALTDGNADGDALDAGETTEYATGLSGANDVVRAQDGSLYVTGTFASDFSSSTVTRLLPDGDDDGSADGVDQEWLTGFGFTGALTLMEGTSGLVPGAAGDGWLVVGDFDAPDRRVRSAPLATLALTGTVANNSSFTLSVGGADGVPSILALSLDQQGVTLAGIGDLCVGFTAPHVLLSLAPIVAGQSSQVFLLHHVEGAVGLSLTAQAFTLQGGDIGISNGIDAVIAP